MPLDWIDADKMCYVCLHVVSKERTVSTIQHEHDGDIVFGCGVADHEDFSAWRMAHAKHVIKDRPRLKLVTELPIGHQLEWEDEAWVIYSIPEDEDREMED
jgi:hypothetical protein